MDQSRPFPEPDQDRFLFAHSLQNILGPFTIRSKASQMIPFKNIFNKPTEFHLVIDNPHFTIPKDVELIKPKKTQYFCVNYTGNF